MSSSNRRDSSYLVTLMIKKKFFLLSFAMCYDAAVDPQVSIVKSE